MRRRFDADGYERRDAWMAAVECVECGKLVSLRSETDQWVLMRDGKRWRHDGYGPAMGECCGLLYAEDAYGGVQVFVLQESNSAAPNVTQYTSPDESPPEGDVA